MPADQVIDRSINPRECVDGEPWPLFTSAQLKLIDRTAIAMGTPGIQLMLRAARAVVDLVVERWQRDWSVVVVTGAGNNGGDGYLVAKLLHERGWSVTVLDLAATKYDRTADDSSELRSEASQARRAMLRAGIVPIALQNIAVLATELEKRQPMVIIDAMLGIGLQSEPRALYLQVIEAINRSVHPVVAVDLPSGLCSDSGQVLGDAVRADFTVTFIALKRGLMTDDAVDYCGELLFNSLGVELDRLDLSQLTEKRGEGDGTLANMQAAAQLVSLPSLLAKLPSRANNSHKRRSGHVLVIGGDHGMAGAPLLSATAALRLGAGLVSVATRAEHVPICVQSQPELMACAIDDNQSLQTMLDRSDTVVIGPGLGLGDWSRQLLKATLEFAQHSKISLVVDADALTLIAADEQLRKQVAAQPNVVMTPHPGEAKRLLAALNHESSCRFAVARALAEGYGCTLVLKGAGTIVHSARHIDAPEQSDTAEGLGAIGQNTVLPQLCPWGNPVLATAGTGDVLAGAIAAFIARGMSLVDATALAVVLHAKAADSWRAEKGREGFVASELWRLMPRLLNRWVVA